MERRAEKRQGQGEQEPQGKRQRISEGPIPQKVEQTEDFDDLKHQAAEMRRRMPRGYRMMSHMGYRDGTSLGSQEMNKYNTTRLKTPLEQAANQQNNSFNQENESIPDSTAGEQFRLWTSDQQNKKRNIDIWRNMQKLAFEMSGDADICLRNSDPRDFNVLWRPYVRELIETSRQEPLVEEPDTDDDDAVESKYEKDGVGELDGTIHMELHDSNIEIESLSDQSDDSDDEELKLLYEMDVGNRLMKLHIFLRCELNYCYYCGVRYEDEQDLHANCPGLTEAEHR